MKKPIKKVGVITSGGDAPGMNAAIRAVVRACSYYKVECLGFYRGYQGIIEGDYTDLDARSVKNIISKGGTILKSARSADFRTKEGRKKAYESLKEAEIDGLINWWGWYIYRRSCFRKRIQYPFYWNPRYHR